MTRIYTAVVILFVLCAALYSAIINPNRAVAERLIAERDHLRSKNAELERANAELGRRVEALRTDPRLVARRARQAARLSHPDEIVIHFPDASTRAPRLHVELTASPSRVALAGEPVPVSELGAELTRLRAERPGAVLRTTIDERLGAVARQRLLEIVDASGIAREGEDR